MDKQTNPALSLHFLAGYTQGSLTRQMYSNVTAEYERSVRGTIRVPKHFLQPWEIPWRSTATQEKCVWPWKDKRVRGPWLRGKQMEPSICWEVSPRTWFEQQKTGSHWGQKSWPLKRQWKGLGKQAHPWTIPISSASWQKTARNCFYQTLLPSSSEAKLNLLNKFNTVYLTHSEPKLDGSHIPSVLHLETPAKAMWMLEKKWVARVSQNISKCHKGRQYF